MTECPECDFWVPEGMEYILDDHIARHDRNHNASALPLTESMSLPEEKLMWADLLEDELTYPVHFPVEQDRVVP